MDETADTSRVLTVELELHLDAEPPSGCLRAANGEEHAFVGWLCFVETLQRLQARPPSRGG